jgi:hypothetical protein
MAECGVCGLEVLKTEHRASLACGHEHHLLCFYNAAFIQYKWCPSCPPSETGRVLSSAALNLGGKALCDAPSLSALVDDPLAMDRRAGARDAGEHDAGVMGYLRGVFATLGNKMDARDDMDHAVLVRRGIPVQLLIERGVHADSLVAHDRGHGRLFADMVRNYTAEDFFVLGFTWEALVSIGLDAATWECAREAAAAAGAGAGAGAGAAPVVSGGLTAANCARVWHVDAALLMSTLCDGQFGRMPFLRLTAEEWVSLGAPPTQIDTFLDLGMDFHSFLAFGISMEHWHTVLGMNTQHLDDPRIQLDNAAICVWLDLDSGNWDTSQSEIVRGEFQTYFGRKITKPDDPVPEAEESHAHVRRAEPERARVVGKVSAKRVTFATLPTRRSETTSDARTPGFRRIYSRPKPSVRPPAPKPSPSPAPKSSPSLVHFPAPKHSSSSSPALAPRRRP